MDHIFIRDLRIEARVGFHKRERHAPQTLRLDLEIGIANDAVFASDRVADCIDYDTVVTRIRALLGEGHFNLVETIADRIARLTQEIENTGLDCPLHFYLSDEWFTPDGA